MKRLMLSLTVLALVLVISAFAQESQQKKTPAPMGQMGMMHGMMQGKMGGMKGGPQRGPMAFLNLTDEQQAKVQDLALAHQKEMIAIQAELQKQHAAMKLEVTADKFNEGKVKSIQGEISKLMSDIAMKTILHQRAVRDLLTPEQKKQFDHHILAGGMMGGRGGMGPVGMMGRAGKMGPQDADHGGMMRQGAKNGPMGDGQCKCMNTN